MFTCIYRVRLYIYSFIIYKNPSAKFFCRIRVSTLCSSLNSKSAFPRWCEPSSCAVPTFDRRTNRPSRRRCLIWIFRAVSLFDVVFDIDVILIRVRYRQRLFIVYIRYHVFNQHFFSIRWSQICIIYFFVLCCNFARIQIPWFFYTCRW